MIECTSRRLRGGDWGGEPCRGHPSAVEQAAKLARSPPISRKARGWSMSQKRLWGLPNAAGQGFPIKILAKRWRREDYNSIAVILLSLCFHATPQSEAFRSWRS